MKDEVDYSDPGKRGGTFNIEKLNQKDYCPRENNTVKSKICGWMTELKFNMSFILILSTILLV